MKRALSYLFPSILAAFALLTLFLTTSILLDLFGIREKEGNYVSFVVWANFFCSWLYLSAAYAWFKGSRIAVFLLVGAAGILLLSLIGLFFHINSGGVYETKTIGALIFRIILSVVFAIFAHKRIRNKSLSSQL